MTPTGDSYTCAAGGRISAGRRFIGGNRRVSIWGQSNAVGRADATDISASPLSSDAGLAAFAAATFERVWIFNGTVYQKLNIATNNQAAAGQFGPEFGLAVRWMRETTSGNLFLEKEAAGGQSIVYFDPAGGAYAAALVRRGYANTWLNANGYSSIIDDGFLWIQGETDYQQTQSWYQTRLEAVLSANLSNGISTSTTRRILTRMQPTSGYYGAGVDAALVAVASANSTTTSAPRMINHYKVDGYHMNGQGQVQTGYDAFETFFSASHIAT